ncbi:MAG: anti-sigma regulatory factor [Cyanobacteria bacterium P01_D01_bin.105]
MIQRVRQQERIEREENGRLVEHLDNHADLNQRSYLLVGSRLEALATVQKWFHNLLNQSQSPTSTPPVWVGESFDELNLALAEGFTNAVRHAHANLPSSTPIVIEGWVQCRRIEIRIFDQGEPFDPDSLVEPQPGTLREGGYGWFLLRRLVDEATYESAQPEFLIKRLFASESVHSIHTYVTSSHADIERICNCLKLVKIA